MKVLSLFDGISCGMVALERAGIPVERYVAYEIEEDPIKVSKHNYPMIEQKGDVFKAEYTEGEFDLLIGGSPCTHWSVASAGSGKRETTSSGIGWDLFSQYARALKEAKPKYFLYENNYSMSRAIKEAITKELGVEPIYINSSLLSAQNRKRLYWTNIPNITMPKDKGVMLNDIVNWNEKKFRPVGKWVFNTWGKSGKKPKIDMLHDVNSAKSHTVTTKNCHSMAYYLNEDKTQYCNLSIRDLEQLQTLPVGYVDNVNIKRAAKEKAIGNGWTVDVIAHIFKGLK
jgi:DNA (cytosine-5)-methyltransferase 3A